jgi:GT2 family glycosyltransferase
MDGTLVSVIIPTLGRYEPLLASVRDLLAQDHRAIEILVVDQNDAWPDALVARRDALRADPRVRWIERFPIGVVRARNHAVALARGELLLFVDDDVWIPDPGFVGKHVTVYADPAVDCVCGRELKLHQVDERTRAPRVPPGTVTVPVSGRTPLEQLLAFDRSAPFPARIPTFSTCNGSIRRSTFLRVGGFDESFVGASYGDDADLVLRLWAHGAGVAYDPSPWLVHLLAPGGLRTEGTKTRDVDRDKCLSGLIVLFRHAGPLDGWPVLYGWVLRRSVLLRKNVVRPWRQPRVALTLASATLQAYRAHRRGPISSELKGR